LYYGPCHYRHLRIDDFDYISSNEEDEDEEDKSHVSE
jgi:hypothetical protein